MHRDLGDGLVLGSLTADERRELRRWAVEEGWNPGRHDIDIAAATDPEAFVALRHAGEFVGGGTIYSHGGAFGFMGLFIVRPDHRGRGWGGRLWHARRDMLLDRLRPGAAIGMDGVITMAPFYGRGGFVEAYRDIRFDGIAHGDPDADIVEVGPSDDALRSAVLALDAFEVDRRVFLTAWIEPIDVHTVAAIDDGRVTGFGVLRPCATGFRFGPVIADTQAVARRIVSDLMHRVEGAPVQLDVPACNPHALALAAEWQMTSAFECARMYHGRRPEVDMARVFGVASFEFG